MEDCPNINSFDDIFATDSGFKIVSSEQHFSYFFPFHIHLMYIWFSYFQVFKIFFFSNFSAAQSAGAVEYADCLSVEG